MKASVNEVAKFLEHAYNELINGGGNGANGGRAIGTYYMQLNDYLELDVGWMSGFDEEDSPWGDGDAICAEICVNDDMPDIEWATMPYYENGEVWDTNMVLGDDCANDAEWYVQQAEAMIPEIESGELKIPGYEPEKDVDDYDEPILTISLTGTDVDKFEDLAYKYDAIVDYRDGEWGSTYADIYKASEEFCDRLLSDMYISVREYRILMNDSNPNPRTKRESFKRKSRRKVSESGYGPRSYDYYLDRDDSNSYRKRNARNGYNIVNPKGQSSFYGKAIKLDLANGGIALKSYKTIVCGYEVDPETGALEFRRYWDDWSATSMKHINAFRNEMGDDNISKAQWMKMPVVKTPKTVSESKHRNRLESTQTPNIVKGIAKKVLNNYGDSLESFSDVCEICRNEYGLNDDQSSDVAYEYFKLLKGESKPRHGRKI